MKLLVQGRQRQNGLLAPNNTVKGKMEIPVFEWLDFSEVSCLFPDWMFDGSIRFFFLNSRHGCQPLWCHP